MPVCLFDIDGTLIDASGAGERAMRKVLADKFQLQEITGHIPAAGRTDAAITKDLLVEHGIDLNRLDEFQSAYFEQLPAALGEVSGRVLPGVIELLTSLGELESVHLGLLTGNFESSAKAKLDHYELGDWFRFGAYGDKYVNRDDVARDALDAVKRHLPDRTAGATWVIGDTPADIRCARSVGAKVIAVATGIFSHDQLVEHEPDLLVDTLEDTSAIVQAILE